MVPLDRALVSSHRLSIVTMSLSAAVWPQFRSQSCRLHPSSMCVETVSCLFTDTNLTEVVLLGYIERLTGMKTNELVEVSQDREAWRELVVACVDLQPPD